MEWLHSLLCAPRFALCQMKVLGFDIWFWFFGFLDFDFCNLNFEIPTFAGTNA
jgi:hypothetical protein